MWLSQSILFLSLSCTLVNIYQSVPPFSATVTTMQPIDASQLAVSWSTDNGWLVGWLVYGTVPLMVTDRHTSVLEVNWLTILFISLKYKFSLCTWDIKFQKFSEISGTPGPLITAQTVSLTVQLHTWTATKYKWKIKFLFSHLRLIKLLIYPLSHLLKDYSVEFRGWAASNVKYSVRAVSER